MDKNEELQKWLNDDRYVQIKDLSMLWHINPHNINYILKSNNIKCSKKIIGKNGGYRCFYDKKKCELARPFVDKKEELVNYLGNEKYVQLKQLADLWQTGSSHLSVFLKMAGIKPTIFNMGRSGGKYYFYDRAECERARPFINQPEQKEIKTMEEKQMELPEPKEQTPDIIPADTIDLFTMPELESELKNRGVELTAEVRAKINASDMPEMQHIATMLRGNAKTITIRLSVLNEIAEQLRGVVENNDTDQDFERDKKAFLTAWHVTCRTLNRPCKTWECMSALPLYLRQDQARRTFIHESCMSSGELEGNHKDGFCCAKMTFTEKKEEPNAATLIDRLDAKLCQIDSAMNQLRVESAEIRRLVAEIKLAISPQLC